ncbi:MAG: choice-of-anchor V domain-containing protein [Chitinophagales bacterium]|nr:choice-of-anchor V domain-containing protein [Chitinophagales bacterium]
MKKLYALSLFFLVVCFMTLQTGRISSKITSPPPGSAGDPFTNSTCVRSGCHGGSLTTPNSNDLTLTIGTGSPTTPLNASFQYTPNTDYNIGFLINAFTGRYGFQITALDANNEKAGNFTVTNAGTTKINTSAATGTRQYMGHNNANTTKNWTFKWTSPAASTGPVTFYYTFATEDGDGDPDSDVIYRGSVTIQPASVISTDDLLPLVNALSVFPNPIISELTVSGHLTQTGAVRGTLFSLDGKLSRQLWDEPMTEGAFTKNFDVSDMPAGVYLLHLSCNGKQTSRKIYID